MSLQTIFEMGKQLTINRRKMVGIQYSRSQVPKVALTPTKNPWRFTVDAAGKPWIDMRQTIEALDTLDRFHSEVITLGSNPNFAWLYRYQGKMSDIQINSLLVDSFIGNQLVLTNLPSIQPTDILFQSGDMIQIQNSPHPFTVTETILRGTDTSVTITTHRPNIITASVVGRSIRVGKNCQIRMFCPNMPNYRLTPGAQRVFNGVLVNNGIVEWEEPFQLYESVGEA
jgi:hypothetical protein